MSTSNFQMSDIGQKIPTYRLAVAQGSLFIGEEAFSKVINKQIKKGDPITVAEIAGIQGAKKAYEMLPLCHPMLLDQVEIFIETNIEKSCLTVTCFASTVAKTGVEMEALCGVNAALLAAYDLIKSVEKNQLISDVSLLVKKGGKTGVWLSDKSIPEWILKKAQIQTNSLEQCSIKSAVITLSDRSASNVYQDKSGEILKELLVKNKTTVIDYRLLPDEKDVLKESILDIIKTYNPHLILTTGGTGPSKRDITSQVISELADKTLPGIGEMLRLKGSLNTQLSWLSCSLAAIVGETLIICLPGSPKAVLESFDYLAPLLPHLLQIIKGSPHDNV